MLPKNGLNTKQVKEEYMFRKKNKKEENFNNPYLNAKNEWFERYGSYIVTANIFKSISLAALLGLTASISLNVYQFKQQKIVPYIIEVDKLGNAIATKPLLETNTIPQRLIQSEIVNAITNWRTVTADLDLQNRLVTKFSAYLGGSARGTIREWYEINLPHERAKQVLVSVDVEGLPLPVSSDSWRISWKETSRNHAGNTIESVRYEATVAIITVPPKNEAEIIQNPAGIIITSINYCKILGQ